MRLGPWGTFVFRTTVVGLLVAATFGMAQEGPPSGKVSMESKSVARGIGVSWGDGKLTYQGKERVFSVDGLSVVDRVRIEAPTTDENAGYLATKVQKLGHLRAL